MVRRVGRLAFVLLLGSGAVASYALVWSYRRPHQDIKRNAVLAAGWGMVLLASLSAIVLAACLYLGRDGD